MTVDFTKPVLYDAANNGYMVTLDNGYPYEVLSTDALWSFVQAWLAVGNAAPVYVPPAPIPPTPQQQAIATIQAIQAKLINAQVVGPNAISLGLTATDIANWKAAQAVLAGN